MDDTKLSGAKTDRVSDSPLLRPATREVFSTSHVSCIFWLALQRPITFHTPVLPHKLSYLLRQSHHLPALRLRETIVLGTSFSNQYKPLIVASPYHNPSESLIPGITMDLVLPQTLADVSRSSTFLATSKSHISRLMSHASLLWCKNVLSFKKSASNSPMFSINMYDSQAKLHPNSDSLILIP